MIERKKIIYVICEGESEMAYLSEFNRFLREEGIAYVFYTIKATNGMYNEVKKTYYQVRKKNKKERIEILVDRDIYIRDEEGMRYRKREEDNLPFFLFSYFNFEDFLVMHLDEKKVKRWNDVALFYKHNIIPLKAKEYVPLLNYYKIWPRGVKYKKGEVPFALSWWHLKNLIRNDRDKEIVFHSDLTRVIEEVLFERQNKS